LAKKRKLIFTGKNSGKDYTIDLTYFLDPAETIFLQLREHHVSKLSI